MAEYWSKRGELPVEVTAADEASSDEEGDNSDDNADDDDDINGASSVAAASSPGAELNDDDETPDVAYARFRAQKASSNKSGFSGWRAELRAWNKSISPKHSVDMDLCKYWEVRTEYLHYH